jgi:hypothetical protein
MNRSDSRAACVVLASLWTGIGAQAQNIHKCMVNGQVSYQSTPCPASDVVLQAAPTPSEQESRQARVDLSRQRFQAATGTIARPIYVSPPPPPPPPPNSPVTTTTVIVMPSAGRGTVIVRQTTRGTTSSASQKPLTNCEKLNRDNNEAQDRREQLRAPGELASRREMLQKAEADVMHIQQMSAASNCRLAR